MKIPNVKFKRAVTAEINLSRDEWQLYSSMPESEAAVPALNRALEAAIAGASNPLDAMHAFFPTMRKFEELGATDSEPQYVARQICAAAFGEEW